MADVQPPPSLQKLVENAGAWHKITPQAWAEFYIAMEKWKASVRYGDAYVEERAQRVKAKGD